MGIFDVKDVYNTLHLLNSKKIILFVIAGVIYVALRAINGHVNISIREYGDFEILSVFIYTFMGMLGTWLFSPYSW